MMTLQVRYNKPQVNHQISVLTGLSLSSGHLKKNQKQKTEECPHGEVWIKPVHVCVCPVRVRSDPCLALFSAYLFGFMAPVDFSLS